MSKHVHMHMCLCLDTVKESPFKEGLTYVIQLSYTPGMLYALYGLCDATHLQFLFIYITI